MFQDMRNPFRPFAPPHMVDDVYTTDQHRRLVQVIRENGPWRQIMANVFSSPEELLASTSGTLPDGVEPSFDLFLTTNFQGTLTRNGACLYPEIEDCFFNSRLMDLARNYWGAKYAKPEFMHFIINGPCENNDPGHLDSASFRGIERGEAATWLLAVMPKSGLFRHWQLKKTQVVTWFYLGQENGGFTYWPEGPSAPPQRVPPPMWNRAVVSENEVMYHRAESNGLSERRKPAGLAMHSLFEADPETTDGWRILTDGEVIQRIPAEETRLMIHWNGEVFMDLDEIKMILDHTDDLTLDRVFDIFIEDLRDKGHRFEVPTDPLRDQQFISLLTRVYDSGTPKIYPVEAPPPLLYA